MNELLNTERRLDTRQLVIGALALQLLVVVTVLFEQVGVELSVLRPFLVVVYLTFVPGLLFCLLIGVDFSSKITALTYTYGTSLILVMAVGAVASLALPPIGLANPLSAVPFLFIMLGVVIALAAGVLRSHSHTELRIEPGTLLSPVPLVLLLLPFVSIYGTLYYDLTGENWLLIAMLVAVALVPLAVSVRSKTSSWFSLATWTSAIALLYHGRSGPFIGGSQLSVISIETGVWVPNLQKAGSLLPNGVLFPVYSTMSDLPISIEWGLVNPFLVSFLPVTLYQVFRRQMSNRRAFVATCVFMFSFPFYVLYPGAGRVATPVIFLALLGLAFTDEGLPDVTRGVLLLMFAAGTAVSHYGTAYVAMFSLFASVVVLLSINLFDDVWDSNNGTVVGVIIAWVNDNDFRQSRTKVLSPSFILFFFTFGTVWYMYTASGAKFRVLPAKIVSSIEGVLYGQYTGSAAGAVARNYGTPSITLSKQIYLILGATMAIGAVYLLFLRLIRQKRVVSDEYLAVSTGFLGMLSLSFLPGGDGFNIARVMMIVFTFTIPLSLFGLDAVTNVLSRGGTRVFKDHNAHHYSAVILASLLLVFLVLNTGVASELAFKEYAPSRQVSEQRLVESEDPQLRIRELGCVGCYIETHAWGMNHATLEKEVYGDAIVWAQVDFFRGKLTSRTGFVPSNYFYTSYTEWPTPTDESELFVLMPHNVDTNGYTASGRYDWRSLDPYRSTLNESSLVYDAGNSHIYYHDQDTINAS